MRVLLKTAALVVLAGAALPKLTQVRAQSCSSCPSSSCQIWTCDGSAAYGGPVDWCLYPDRGCDPSSGYTAQGDCCCLGTPIVVDVDGDGISLTSGEDGVPFRIGSTSALIRVAWTEPGSDDAWLALDRNRNGVIDDARELFGNLTSQPTPSPPGPRNGFNALAVFDSPAEGGNVDGRIDSSDLVYSRLLSWQDRNHNGLSESNELHSLPELGVVAIDLKVHEARRVDEFGNQFRYRARIIRDHGTHVGEWAWDVLLTAAANIH